ncbi:lipopolysaccharide heptosyltransferase I [Pseudothauera nasutitermitis]|uniref:Lipopolysaccharide heptosyltransferase 1 n=1 Tax=Pseudothauera nasutitermitis TaxID=2565930 RepID=A0A4S4AX14_9RHOO|nr:lipopolysaccharide heptosyltransferase I [Pseudothauera nasutitermitis]THF63148.1 lipopolysaccharide heptosyltransferase I [Pseudothauera nasutitermitis]
MRVLLVKTSSLGDIIHTLPALTDAARARPGIRFDWVVEEAFAEIPAWHPAVDRVIPVAIRRWRKAPLRAWASGEWRRFTRELLATRYDLTLDAQGLLKSALLTRYASTPVHGLDRNSAREALAARFYTHRHHVARGQHAVARTRALFAHTLGYPVPTDAGAYGLDRARVLTGAAGAGAPADPRPYLVFLHGTTWPTKHWPEAYWRELLETATAAGWPVRLPWGCDAEHQRAQRLAQGLPDAHVLPRLPLAGMATQLAGARACVAVDTGLGHLAAALDVPTLSLFGPTNPGFTGAWGPGQIHLPSDFPCAPCLSRTCAYRPTEAEQQRFDTEREWPLCFTRANPQRVWQALQPTLHPESPL